MNLALDSNEGPSALHGEIISGERKSESETVNLTAEFLHGVLSGASVQAPDLQIFGDYAPVVEGIWFARNNGSVDKAREAAVAMSRKDAAVEALLAPILEQLKREAPSIEYPALPDWIIPAIPYQGAGEWLNDYISYAALKSPMTPQQFHESAGLQLFSIAIARRLVLEMPHDNVYSNLFILWLAYTTLFRKTTALNTGSSLVRRACPHLLAAQDTTPEALLSDMGGEKPRNLENAKDNPEALKRWEAERNYAAQKGWIIDEMSGLLANSGKDYNAGLQEFLMKAFDCEPEYTRSSRGQGKVVARNMYLSILGSSTPAGMAPYLNDSRLWHNGWWARFALLTPDVERPEWKVPPDSVTEPPSLLQGLMSLQQRLPQATWPNPPQALAITLGSGVREVWGQYNKAVGFDLITPGLDPRLHGTYGRLPTQALKVAIILATMDWSDKAPAPHIELPHLVRAVRIAEEWRVSAHRVLAQASRSDYDRQRERVLKHVASSGKDGASVRDLTRAMRDRKPDEIENTLMQLVKAGEIESLGKSKSPGRPTTKYRIAS
jgi:hypothetical protein